MKLLIADVLQTRELRRKRGRDGVGTGTAIRGAEVEIMVVPFRENIHQVIPVGLFGRSFEVFGL